MTGKKIRDDLEGVVYVGGHTLKAGDEIPDGVELGDHLFDAKPQGPADKKPARKTAAE